MTAINTKYSSYCLRWFLDIVAGAEAVQFANKLFDFPVATQITDIQYTPLGSGMFVEGTSISLEARLETMIIAAHLAIHGDFEAYTVRVNIDGHLEVFNPSAKPLYLLYGIFTTMPAEIWGFGRDGALGATFSAGVTIISPYQVGAQWNPNMFFANDTGDIPHYKIAQSNTNLMRPHYLKYGDTIYTRVIDWEALGAGRVRRNRVTDQLFADSSQLTVNDLNAPLEVMVEHVHNEAEVGLGRVWLFSNASSATGVKIGEYYVMLDESSLLEGVTDEARFQASSLETFNLTLAMRKY